MASLAGEKTQNRPSPSVRTANARPLRARGAPSARASLGPPSRAKAGRTPPPGELAPVGAVPEHDWVAGQAKAACTAPTVDRQPEVGYGGGQRSDRQAVTKPTGGGERLAAGDPGAA